MPVRRFVHRGWVKGVFHPMKFVEPSIEYCRLRVTEAREMAARNEGPGTKADWLQIAQRWEHMAQQAEARDRAKVKPREH